jgi:hypothetical protein
MGEKATQLMDPQGSTDPRLRNTVLYDGKWIQVYKPAR